MLKKLALLLALTTAIFAVLAQSTLKPGNSRPPRLIPAGGSFDETYLDYLQSTRPIAIWALDDPDTVARNYGTLGAAANGTHTGVTPGQPGVAGRASLLYDGTNDYTTIYSASLLLGFNGAEGTLSGWFKPGAIWEDSTIRYFYQIGVSDNFRVFGARTATNNQMLLGMVRNSTPKYATINGRSDTTWMHLTVVWSMSGNHVRPYINAVQQGADITTLAAWAGDLSNDRCYIGAYKTNPAPANILSGNAQFVTLWTRALTQPEVTAVYTRAFQSANLEMEWDWLAPRKRLAKVLAFPVKKPVEVRRKAA